MPSGTLKNKKTQTCIVCGKEFALVRAKQVMCSQECRRKRKLQLQEKWRSEYRKEHPAPFSKSVVCAICGKKIEIPARSRQKYCSLECKTEGTRLVDAKRRGAYVKHHRIKAGGLTARIERYREAGMTFAEGQIADTLKKYVEPIKLEV